MANASFGMSKPEKTIVMDLMDDRYDQLIVEVADPPEVVRTIQDAISQRA
jgi:hypothetical protein